MRKIFALIIVISLIATLCSCKKINDDIYSSSSSESDYVSKISTVTSETEESDVSDSESDDITLNITVSTPVDNTSSEPVVDDTSKEEPTNESSKEQTTEGKPKEPVNFVPNRISAIPGSDKKVIVLSNKILYKETRYAYTNGKNNGVDCGAIITVDADGEYLSCVSVLNAVENERSIFSVYNDRIYYLKCAQSGKEDYKPIENLQVWSMNLSGEDKKQEKEISVPFTHMSTINGIANSKYMIFPLYNGFDYTYSYYRYDITTKDTVKISTPEFDEGFYINENQMFGYDADNLKFYKFDINLSNKQLLLDVSTITSDYVLIDIVQNGFIFTVESTNSKYFLDLNGNISKK